MKTSIKKNFSELSLRQKCVVIASFFATLSTLMPWYQDEDPFGGTALFYGLTGPLYLLGFFVFALSGTVLLTSGLLYLYKHSLKTPFDIKLLWLACGIQSLMLIIMAASAFYHSKFGYNIYAKETKFGFFLAFISTLIYSISAYRLYHQPEAEKNTFSTYSTEAELEAEISRTHTGIKSLSETREKESAKEPENLTLDL